MSDVPATTTGQASTDGQATLPPPAKLLRIGSMVKQLLDELHAQPLDDRGRDRLQTVYGLVLDELSATLPSDLRAELAELATPLRTGAVVSDAELRIANAQLVGWLEGLFQGVQFAAVLHRMTGQQPD